MNALIFGTGMTVSALLFGVAMFVDALRQESEFKPSDQLRLRLLALLTLLSAIACDYSPSSWIGVGGALIWSLATITFIADFIRHMIGRVNARRSEIRSQRYRI